jgi:hypothetical protein
MSQSSNKRKLNSRSDHLPSYAQSSDSDEPFDSDDDIYADEEEQERFPDPEEEEEEVHEEEPTLKRWCLINSLVVNRVQKARQRPRPLPRNQKQTKATSTQVLL